MSTLMEIMPDKPPLSIDVKTNGDNARQGTSEYRCLHKWR